VFLASEIFNGCSLCKLMSMIYDSFIVLLFFVLQVNACNAPTERSLSGESLATNPGNLETLAAGATAHQRASKQAHGSAACRDANIAGMQTLILCQLCIPHLGAVIFEGWGPKIDIWSMASSCSTSQTQGNLDLHRGVVVTMQRNRSDQADTYAMSVHAHNLCSLLCAPAHGTPALACRGCASRRSVPD
jgi:hypothetical protein